MEGVCERREGHWKRDGGGVLEEGGALEERDGGGE